MTFNDIIKKSFLEQFNTVDISAMSIMISLLVALLLGGFVFWIYRSVCTKSFYSKNFAISLIVISLITTIVIMTVKSNLIISLGMVGALSIVRFRTPIKEPIDLAFLFWSIAIGIICGAGTYQIAFIGSLIIAISIMLFQFIPDIKQTSLLLINTTLFDNEKKINAILKETTSYAKLRSRNKTLTELDLIIEIRTENEDILLEKLSEIENISNLSIVRQENNLI